MNWPLARKAARWPGSGDEKTAGSDMRRAAARGDDEAARSDDVGEAEAGEERTLLYVPM
ncbi:MAG: hypothetical protein IPK72_21425 [Candidatus Eisenbacteria bacterium]|nr:hypothetical protein [Candidatus Eisenbacteria bacterium]